MLVVAAALIGFLAYGVEPDRSGEVRVAGLTAPAGIGWMDDGTRVIEAPDAQAAAAALGYAHAVDDTWSMLLWRQVATAGLSGWFGGEMERLDEHVARLGFAADARRAYAALSDSSRAVLDAYAAGANAALDQSAVRQADELALLGAEPDRWAPWHTLATERLVAYLGTDPLPRAALADSFAVRYDSLGYALPDSQRVGQSREPLRRYAAADSTLRAYLHLGTFGRSYAFATDGLRSGPVLMTQVSYGASALPLVREVVFRRGRTSVTAVTIPGTLMVPAGSGPGGAWSVLLGGSLEAESAPFPSDLRPTRQRIVFRDGAERLVTAYQQPGRLFVGPAPPRPRDTLSARPLSPDSALAPDTSALSPGTLSTSALSTSAQSTGALSTGDLWAVSWQGFGASADALTWSRLLDAALAGRVPSALPLALIPGDGLVAAADGSVQVLGAPAVRADLPGGVFVGGHPVLAYPARRLAATLAADTLLTAPRLAADTYSAWAAERLPPLLEVIAADTTLRATLAGDPSDSLGTAPAPPPASTATRRPTGTAARYQNGLAYLSGWDYRYQPDAIAGTIFDTWTVVHEERTGGPLVAAGDSAAEIRASLRLALARLVDQHGEEPSAWRWANAATPERRFPVWSSGSERLADERYRPAPLDGGGHPTALLPGPSPAFRDLDLASAWTGWTAPGSSAWYVRHPTLSTRGFLARYVETRDPALPHAVGDEDVRVQLRLVPASAQ